MIEVGEKYRVGARSRNIVLYSKVEKQEDAENLDEDEKVEGGWYIAGYFSNVENALMALVEREVEKTKMKDLQTVLDAIKEVQQDIRNLNVSDIRGLSTKALRKKETVENVAGDGQ